MGGGRAARKLQQLKQQQQQQQQQLSSNFEDNDELEYEIIDSDSLPSSSKSNNIAPFNPFLLLNDAGDDNDEDNDVDEEEELMEEEEFQDHIFISASQQPQSSSKKKKKKKNKTNNRNNNDKNNIIAAELSSSSSSNDPEMDEIVAAINEIKTKFGDSSTEHTTNPTITSSSSQKHSKSSKPLLGVESKHLDAEAELRRIFGSRIIQEELKNKRRIRERGPQQTRRGGAAGVRFSKTVLATPRDTWPHLETRIGLSMIMIQAPSFSSSTEQRNGIFSFQYSSTYEEIERMFLDCVNSHDPASISSLLRVYPFHVNSLIQMSEVFRHNGDLETAAEYIGN